MRVLITGITGFVGSHLVDYIIENNPSVEIFGLKRWRSSLDNIEHVMHRITLHDGDLRDLSSMIHLLDEVKPDAIFHLAAQSFVPTSYSSPADTLYTNAIGTVNLLEAVRFARIDPVIHICSSSEVYGQVKPEDIPIKEDSPLRPASPYAVSKVTEDLLGWQYFICYGLKTIRTRMFTHTGPRRGDVFVESNFAKQIATIEAGPGPPVVWVGNLDSIRTFADVRDTTRAYWVMVQSYFEGKVAAGEVFNIGGSTTMTIGEMLDRLLALSPVGNSVDVRVDERRIRPADVTLQIPCVDKFREATGWEPSIPFETTLKDLLDYWRARIASRPVSGFPVSTSMAGDDS